MNLNPLTKEEVAEMSRLYVAGAGKSDLALQFGISFTLASVLLAGVRQPVRPRAGQQVYVWRHRHTGEVVEKAESRDWVIGPKAAELHAQGFRLIRDGKRVLESNSVAGALR